MNKNKTPLTKGFTLIEIILGLMIFSLVSLMLYNVFWLGVKIQGKADIIDRNYQEAFVAFELMTKELENAIFYDFSGSYKDDNSFKGEEDRCTFLISTDKGIKRVQYYMDVPDWGKVTKAILNQHLKLNKRQNYSSMDDLPISFLMRKETMFINDLVNRNASWSDEIVAAGLNKDSLKFHYGYIKEDLSNPQGSKDIQWKEVWQESFLPTVVRVEMVVYEPKDSKKEFILKRDIYLSPVNKEDK